jgi:DNA-binding transcriptional ArsR family regulator
MKMQDMQENAHQAADFLKGLASVHRLLILCQLSQGERSVGDLITLTGIAQTSMSQHLAKLKKENIVDYRRDHRVLYYKITNESALKIMNVLYDAYCKKE